MFVQKYLDLDLNKLDQPNKMVWNWSNIQIQTLYLFYMSVSNFTDDFGMY